MAPWLSRVSLLPVRLCTAPKSPRTPLHIASPSLTSRRALATSILQQQVWGVTESCAPGPGAYSLSWNQTEVRGPNRTHSALLPVRQLCAKCTLFATPRAECCGLCKYLQCGAVRRGLL